MSTLIIRKPKFVRDDTAMETYIDVAKSIGNSMRETELSLVEQYNLSKRLSDAIDKAAESGGFFNTNDFLKWMSTYHNT